MSCIVYDIQNVTKTYLGQKEPANHEISLQISDGEIFGLLGDNGAGKTTLVRQMVNLTHPSTGQVLLHGQSVNGDSTLVSQYVGYMPQESYSMNNMTVSEALYFTARLRGFSRSDANIERERLIQEWDIFQIKDKVNTRLSAGQRRLLRLAVAMAGSPPVLILDEPTNDLDPLRRKLVWDNLRKENTQKGVRSIV